MIFSFRGIVVAKFSVSIFRMILVDCGHNSWLCHKRRKVESNRFYRGDRKVQEEDELYNRLIWKEVKNVSITGLIEFLMALEGSRMDSPSFPLSLFHPLHPAIWPGQGYNFITLHLIVCIADWASLSIPANRGRWAQKKKRGIIKRSGKPHHFIFIDGQLLKSVGLWSPLSSQV